jgi:hypothetical protein
MAKPPSTRMLVMSHRQTPRPTVVKFFQVDAYWYWMCVCGEYGPGHQRRIDAELNHLGHATRYHHGS